MLLFLIYIERYAKDEIQNDARNRQDENGGVVGHVAAVLELALLFRVVVRPLHAVPILTTHHVDRVERHRVHERYERDREQSRCPHAHFKSSRSFTKKINRK